MDDFLKTNFEISKLKPLNLKEEKESTWALGIIIGNYISKIGLLTGGIKPQYFLYEDNVIRYTKNEYTKQKVTYKDDNIVKTKKNKYIYKNNQF